jgi:hypothetical protein
MEESALADAVTINFQNNRPYSHSSPTYEFPVADPTFANVRACETVIDIYRCPSAALPEHLPDQGHNGGRFVQNRVPGSYIACASGIATSQFIFQMPNGFRRFLEQTDGVMYGVKVNQPNPEFGKSPVSLGKIPDITHIGELIAASKNGYPGPEPQFGNRKDHWYIGSDSIDGPGIGDPSEGLGSTGVPPNLHKVPDVVGTCRGNAAARHVVGQDCEGLQLSFSSEHPGIVQVVMCDGSVQVVQEDIYDIAWSKMGTRSEAFDLPDGT